MGQKRVNEAKSDKNTIKRQQKSIKRAKIPPVTLNNDVKK